MARLLGIVTLCVAVGLSGCQMDGDAHTVREFKGGKKPPLEKTQYAGRYQLYKVPEHTNSDLDKISPPIFSTHLDKNQWLGFQIDEYGKALAVAGDQRMILQEGRYEWVMNADPGQNDPVRTTVLVVVVVIVVVVVAGIAAFVAYEANDFNQNFLKK